MKKTLSFITAAALLFSGTSCAGKAAESSAREPVINEYGKHVITVGVLGGYNTSAFSDISFPTDIEIDVTYYNKLAGDDNDWGDNAWALLKNDLIAGQAPDIIMLNPHYMAELVKMGVMTDMYPLMDAYEDGLHRGDFLPNVLAGLDVDGTLPALTDLFYIETAAAKTKYIGGEFENWTPEQAMQAFADTPEGMKFIKSYDERGLLDYMAKMVQRQCIDLTDNKCDFTSGEFTKILGFSADNKITDLAPNYYEGMSDEEYQAVSNDEMYAGRNDTYLVNQFIISGFNDQLAWDTYSFFGGEDITFVGYPSADGCGAYTRAGMMYGITESCPDKETAWRVVSFVTNYRKSYDKNAHVSIGLPVTLEHLDLDYRRDESYGSSINRPIQIMPSDEPLVITEEFKKKLYDYILSVRFDPYTDIRIDLMIAEETDYVIAGERSAEECAEILQGRIEIYLSERAR